MDWGGSSEGGIALDEREERATGAMEKERNAFASLIDTHTHNICSLPRC